MDIRNFIFSTKKSFRLKRHYALLWILFYLYLVIAYPPHGGGTLNGLEKDGVIKFYEMASIRGVFHLFFQMLFCYPLLYILMPVFFWKKKYVQFVCLVLLLWIAVSVFRYLSFAYTYNPIMKYLGLYVNPSSILLTISVTQTINGPAFIGFIFIAIKIFKDWQQKQKENFFLQKENFKAELLLLKAQIHPHFLFNTLNNIYFFILSEPGKAEDLVAKLESLLYYMINECDVTAVPLEKEINMINNYFELEKVRYGDRLDVELSITGDYGDKMIAPLLMIPFIENSFKHGTSRMLRDPWIKLFIQADEEVLHFTLANNKPADEISDNKRGIGLSNVKKRLAILHPEKHFLTIEPTVNTFTINMQIPMEHKNKTPRNMEEAFDL